MVLVLSLLGLSSFPHYNPLLRWVYEIDRLDPERYDAAINIVSVIGSSDAYEVGLNVNLEIVFKNPSTALDQIQVDYAYELERLEQEFGYPPLTIQDFAYYRILLCEITGDIGTELWSRALPIGFFVETYANSFSSRFRHYRE